MISKAFFASTSQVHSLYISSCRSLRPCATKIRSEPLLQKHSRAAASTVSCGPHQPSPHSRSYDENHLCRGFRTNGVELTAAGASVFDWSGFMLLLSRCSAAVAHAECSA
jgi:hypothetical protein